MHHGTFNSLIIIMNDIKFKNLTLGTPKQEDLEFKVSLSYIRNS